MRRPTSSPGTRSSDGPDSDTPPTVPVNPGGLKGETLADDTDRPDGGAEEAADFQDAIPHPMPPENVRRVSSYRARFASIVREDMSNNPGMTIVEYTRRAIDVVHADQAFVDALLLESMYQTAYDIAQRVAAEGRNRGNPIVLAGARLMNQEQIKWRAAGFRVAIDLNQKETCFHVPKPVREMTREDCLFAWDYRSKIRDTYAVYAEFYRQMSEELGEGDTIGNRFSQTDVNFRVQMIQESMGIGRRPDDGGPAGTPVEPEPSGPAGHAG